MADEQDDDGEVLKWAGSIVGLIKWAESIGEQQICIKNARAGLTCPIESSQTIFDSIQFVHVN